MQNSKLQFKIKNLNKIKIPCKTFNFKLLTLNSAQGRSGQTLIEVAVALTAAVTIVSVIAFSVVSSLNNAQFSQNQSLATQYSNDGMEFLRKMKNTDWTLFKSYTDVYYCLDINNQLTVRSGSDCGENIGSLIREVEIMHDPSDQCQNIDDVSRVTIFVKWSDSKCTETNLYCHEAKSISCFGEPKKVASP